MILMFVLRKLDSEYFFFFILLLLKALQNLPLRNVPNKEVGESMAETLQDGVKSVNGIKKSSIDSGIPQCLSCLDIVGANKILYIHPLEPVPVWVPFDCCLFGYI